MSDEMPVPAVDPLDAAALIEAGAYLLDVREPDEWEAGHAPAAHHIALGELEGRYHELPTDRQIVCVCRGGGRSGRAAGALLAVGIDAINLAGGMRGWAEQELPVVTDDGSAGSVI
jgi:rhodanese-related sulfurtransferase